MNYSKLASISIIFIGLVLFFAILKEFSSFLRPFFISLILTFLFIPITRVSKEKKVLMILNTVTVVIILFVISSVVGTLFLDQGQELNSISATEFSLIDNVNSLNLNFFGFKPIDFLDTKVINNYISIIFRTIIFSTTDFFKELFLVILFLMFIMPSFDELVKKIELKMNHNERKKFRKSINEIENSIRTYLSVKTLISLGTAIVSGLIMYFLMLIFILLL